MIENKTDGSIDMFEDRIIYVIGSKSFMNALVSEYIRRELGVECICNQSLEDIPNNGGAFKQKPLVLIDVNGQKVSRLLSEITEYYKDVIAHVLVVLFNMNHHTGIEKEVLSQGIRGFFYIDDTPEHFIKGIKVVFDGQLWVSRSLLSECVLHGINSYSPLANPYPIINNENNHLTKREVEILAMVTVGSRNDEIADKLCISNHTVKTHLYNVFKKINVADRLQAALWAAKNL
ncbi:MAG: LuxR C-terminal-related transcriptional regulator [Spirochaetota bacterium]